jgi:hypothetical protein
MIHGTMEKTWARTIAAGKNPLYVARQMGRYSAGFTLEGLESSPHAVSGNLVQPGAAGCLAEGGRFELPIPVRV